MNRQEENIFAKENLRSALNKTKRDNLSLREVAEIIKEVFAKEEVEALVKELE